MPLWTDDGVAICTGSLVAMCPEVVGDGSGGAIITWMDGRSGDLDIYTQRLNAAGLGQWTKNGVAICTAADPQVFPGLVADGSGGAIIAWTDNRSSNLDVYAQRVNADGAS